MPTWEIANIYVDIFKSLRGDFKIPTEGQNDPYGGTK